MTKAMFFQKMDMLNDAIFEAVRNPDWIRWMYIDAVLSLCDGNISATARRLGMHRRTLQRIISAHSQAQLNTTRD